MPPNLLGLTEEQAEQLRDEERRKQKEERSAVEDGADGEEEEEEEEFSGDAGKGEGGGGDGEAMNLAEEMKGLAVVEEGDEGEEDGGGGDGDGSDEEVRWQTESGSARWRGRVRFSGGSSARVAANAWAAKYGCGTTTA